MVYHFIFRPTIFNLFFFILSSTSAGIIFWLYLFSDDINKLLQFYYLLIYLWHKQKVTWKKHTEKYGRTHTENTIEIRSISLFSWLFQKHQHFNEQNTLFLCGFILLIAQKPSVSMNEFTVKITLRSTF